jgi:hypothetical protein
MIKQCFHVPLSNAIRLNQPTLPLDVTDTGGNESNLRAGPGQISEYYSRHVFPHLFSLSSKYSAFPGALNPN